MKMDKLDQFFDKVICADIYLKVENKSEKDNKIFEAKLTVPGDSFMVKKQCKSFEVLAKNNNVILAGEVNSNAKINYNNIVKKICKKI